MIDVKVAMLGGPEVQRTFATAQSALRARLQEELDEIGKDIVLAARAGVPRRTGRTMRRIVYRHGREMRTGFQSAGDDRLILTVLPGEPTAHLIERGVDATVVRRRKRSGDVYEVRGRRQKRKLVAMGISFASRPYRLVIPPRPYFMPAVESIGGASGANQRLQAALDRAAADAQGGG